MSASIWTAITKNAGMWAAVGQAFGDTEGQAIDYSKVVEKVFNDMRPTDISGIDAFLDI